jgi:Protein of unknown function (DUF1549)/Protein of unknown function (DUF1553)
MRKLFLTLVTILLGGVLILPGFSAPDNQHWAFVAPIRPALPLVKNKTWPRNPIDHFILARLEKEALTPAPEADKTTLIRRVSLDLTGLPPTLPEIDAFLADKLPTAYEKVVERLLASPHYGERWGRWWLDAARYADTNGFEKDLPRSIWPYRDWVINAFNQNLPFDQFTIEQLAGDLLPNATLEQKVATGFLRNSMRNEEGGVEPEQFRTEEILDRVDTVGKAWLGLTINCAQCHTHKFDPIKHDEYYKFFAFLNNDDEPLLEVPSDETLQKRAQINAKIAALEDNWIAQDQSFSQRFAAWETKAKQFMDKWIPLDIATFYSDRAKLDERYDDHSVRVESYRYLEAYFTVTANTKLQNITGLKLELLTDHKLPRNGPGVSDDGTLVLSELTLEASPLDHPEQTQKIVFSQCSSDFERVEAPAKLAIDGDRKTGWNSDAGAGRRNQDRHLVFTATTPFGFAKGTTLKLKLYNEAGKVQIIGRFRLSVTNAPNPQADSLPPRIRQIVSLPAEQRNRAQQRALLTHYFSLDPNCAAAQQEIAQAFDGWPDATTTLSLAPRFRPRETHVFRRGDWQRPEPAIVQPDTPAALHPFPQNAPRNRLGLAQWIVDKNNPLTARVIVNRVWQQYFGQGLVTTPEDFGTRCEKPSHPELLDWLAREFWDNGKNLKNIHRLIVNSTTYRQSSKLTQLLQDKDPSNKWLARAPRLRVEAEIVRDVSLAAAGVLSRKIGGPSVFPLLPEGVLGLSYGTFGKWEFSSGENHFRRGMYTFWKRSVPYPSLGVFDQPSADFACTRRTRSNTPLQALTTLNDQTFVEAAQGLALRVWKEGGATNRAKLIYAFRLCTGRPPDAVELQHLVTLLRDQQAYFKGRTAAAVYVASPDLKNLPEGVDLHQIAPWTMVARVLLNLDETITKE